MSHFLGFVKSRIQQCEIVSACMVEHSGFFEVITAFGKDTHVCVGFKDFANKDCVVASGELPIDFTLKVRNAFTDSWRFNFFAWHLGEVGFFEFIKASAR